MTEHESVGWFYSDIGRKEADSLLANEQPGTYLLRPTQSYKGCFCLCYRTDKVDR